MNSIRFLRFAPLFTKAFINSQKVVNKCRHLTTISSEKYEVNSGQHLVIDLSFNDLMTTEECHRLAIELCVINHINSCIEPKDRQFVLNICHQMSKNNIIIEYLSQYLPDLENENNFKVHNKTYFDLFDKQKLVYLSPDAKNVIEFKSNDIYIIGGIIQKKLFKKDSNLMTYLKAKSEGIRVQRFPIDHLISDTMKRGIVLFLPQVFNILTDVKANVDWESALRRHIPFWKLKPIIKSQIISCK